MNIMYFLINYGKAGLISWGAYFVIAMTYALTKARHIAKVMGEAYVDRFADLFMDEAWSLGTMTWVQVAITRTILFPWGIYDAVRIIEEALYRANTIVTHQFEEEKASAE